MSSTAVQTLRKGEIISLLLTVGKNKKTTMRKPQLIDAVKRDQAQFRNGIGVVAGQGSCCNPEDVHRGNAALIRTNLYKHSLNS